MPQLTLHLDDATQALVDTAAKASGISHSHWITAAIRQSVPREWSDECLALAGRFPDFPLCGPPPP